MEGTNHEDEKIPENYSSEKNMYKKEIVNEPIERLKNEILVKHETDIRRSLAYCIDLMYNKQYPNVKILAFSQTMDKAIFFAEQLKRKIKGLHQVTQIKNYQFTENYKPIEATTERFEFTVKRFASLLEILLCRMEPAPEKKGYGYQRPLQLNLVSSRDPREYLRLVLEENKEPFFSSLL